MRGFFSSNTHTCARNFHHIFSTMSSKKRSRSPAPVQTASESEHPEKKAKSLDLLADVKAAWADSPELGLTDPVGKKDFDMDDVMEALARAFGVTEADEEFLLKYLLEGDCIAVEHDEKDKTSNLYQYCLKPLPPRATDHNQPVLETFRFLFSRKGEFAPELDEEDRKARKRFWKFIRNKYESAEQYLERVLLVLRCGAEKHKDEDEIVDRDECLELVREFWKAPLTTVNKKKKKNNNKKGSK